MNEENILLLFGEHVKKLRRNKRLSQEQLSLLADLDRTYISGIERGKRNVSLINLVKLSKSLDIPVHEIISFSMDVSDDN